MNKSVYVANKYLDNSVKSTIDSQYFNQIKNAKKDYKSPYKRTSKPKQE